VTGDRSLVLGRDLTEFARLTAWADGFIQNLGLSHEVAFRLQLCLEEAVSNIIAHGVAASDNPEIRVTLSAAEGSVIAAIEDQGQPFDPSEAPMRPRPSSLDDAAIGGLGILLMRHFVSEMSYERIGTRNRLVVKL
jgi:serine/threonine-protein kinase RsbW